MEDYVPKLSFDSSLQDNQNEHTPFEYESLYNLIELKVVFFATINGFIIAWKPSEHLRTIGEGQKDATVFPCFTRELYSDELVKCSILSLYQNHSYSKDLP